MIDKKFTLAIVALRGYPDNNSFMENVLAKYLPRHNVNVVFLLEVNQEPEPLETLSWIGCEVIPLQSFNSNSGIGRLFKRLRKPFTLAKKLRELHKKSNGLIALHVRDDWLTGLAIYRLTKSLSIPIIFQFSRPGPEFHFLKAQNARHLAKKAFANLNGHIENIGSLNLLRKVDYVLPISSWMQADLEKKGVAQHKMTAVPMGFDPEALEEVDTNALTREMMEGSNGPIAVYFGSMNPGRDLEFLLRSYQSAARKHPDSTLLMIGGQPEDIRRLKRSAAELNLRRNVIFTGYVNRKDVYAYLAAADVSISPIPGIPAFVNSSPTKLIEAMGMGCAVIASDIPEQRMIIQESRGGFCVPYEESAFTEKLEFLFDNPSVAQEMGQAGQRYILENRNYRKMADDLSTLYERLVNQV